MNKILGLFTVSAMAANDKQTDNATVDRVFGAKCSFIVGVPPSAVATYTTAEHLPQFALV